MCYGMNCGFEDSYGECHKPRGVRCPDVDPEACEADMERLAWEEDDTTTASGKNQRSVDMEIGNSRWEAAGDILTAVAYFMLCPLFAGFLVWLTKGF